MASSFKHNKKRNSGLVYEFIVRRMASQAIAQDATGYQKSLKIVKEYFAPGQPLAQERELFEVVCSSRGLSSESARRLLDEVLGHAQKLDHRKIEIKKSNLIKELNYTFGKNFFSEHRVPEYRLLASIQVLLESHRPGRPLLESVQRAQLEESLVRFMTTVDPVSKPGTGDEKVDTLVCALAAKKFQEKYGQNLSPGQARILERYMRATMSEETGRFEQFLLEEFGRMSKVLENSRLMKEVREDKMMAERLDEAIARIKLDRQHQSLEFMTEEAMLYRKLIEELSSDA